MRVCILCAILFIGFVESSLSQNPTYPRIKSMKGYLYYNQNNIGEKSVGTLSENIIDNKDFALWNTIIGEGSAKGSSKNTLIVVEIVNNPNQISVNGYIRLIVKNDKNKILFSQTQDYSILEKGNVFKSPFLLYNTGCGYLNLVAELLDSSSKKVISTLKKRIEFECGE